MVPWSDAFCLILNMRDYIINVDFTAFGPTLTVLTLIQYSEDLPTETQLFFIILSYGKPLVFL
jgi:hypothetical protein